jgi:hypothetical protein
MKTGINKILFIGLVVSLGLMGCKKELDINQNPNQAADENVTSGLILPNALHGAGVQTALGYGWLANWMGYWSASGSFNPSTEESTYNITNTFQEGKWAGIYNVLFDLREVERKGAEEGEGFYVGVAKIIKAHLYQNLVDVYGNVPYSQAFNPVEFPTPAYDPGASIYADLQLVLDTAINLIQNSEVTGENQRIDIVYGGDQDLWVRLANTIKLRLLIRQTETNVNAAAELAKIKANGGVLQSGETAAVDPGYLNDVNKQSPFYGAYGLLPSGEDANTFYRANAHAVEILTSTDDPRLAYFFKPAKSPVNPQNPFVGTIYGSDPNDQFNGDRTSNIGTGLVRSFDQAQWIVTSVESMFLQAEAVQRGWDIGGPYAGNAQAAYEAAVTESFIWLGVEDAEAEAATYISDNFDWSTATTDPERIELIVNQKYIALMGINPLEAWNDYRRLGIPSDVPLSVNDARGSRTIPVRLLYPSAESAVNTANVQAQGDITPQSKIFWDAN